MQKLTKKDLAIAIGEFIAITTMCGLMITLCWFISDIAGNL
jgi:hypothetical protein